MKTAAIFSILIGSVTAFIPSSSRVGYTTSINVSPDLERLVGASVETGGAAVSASSLFLYSILTMPAVAIFPLPDRNVLFIRQTVI